MYKLTRRSFLLSTGALIASPLIPRSSQAALQFPLPAGHFIPAKMPMYPVFPRPDSETQTHARHRWAHPDFRYEIPIGVQGGAWPFKYEIINGPAGATIGQYYGDPDYGVVKWVPANGDTGTKTFTVRVTGQDLAYVDLTWTTTIDANQFVFVDANASTTGDGTINSPLKTFNDWYKNDSNDATYWGKIIVWRDGNYVASNNALNDYGTVGLYVNTKSPIWINYPDETPVIDCHLGKIGINDNLDDLFISGIRFENAVSNVANSQFFIVWGVIDRGTWWNNYFYNLGNGTAGTDNPSGILITNTGADMYNFLVKGNTFDLFTNDGSNGSYVDFYRTYYVVWEENKAINSTNTYGFWAKVTKAFVTIRNNTSDASCTGGGICIWYGDAAPGQPHDHEICWNRIIRPDGDKRSMSFWLMGDTPSPINRNPYNSFVYRNTFVRGRTTLRYGGWDDIPAEKFKVDANVVVAEGTDPFTPNAKGAVDWDTRVIDESIPNLLANASEGATDSSGKLQGDFRNSYLGIIGREISDKDTDFINPKPPSYLGIT